MSWQRILMTVTALLIFLPLATVYFYRAYHDGYKRIGKIAKGLNYIYFALIISHIVLGSFSSTQLATMLVTGLFLLGIMELAYHIDILYDMVEWVKGQIKR